MKVVTYILISCSLLTPGLLLGAENIKFDGETYIKKFTNVTPKLQLTEYIREDETLKNWTKMIAVRNFTNLSDTKSAARQLAMAVTRHNPKAKPNIRHSDATSETEIDFITFPKNAAYMEFNVHKYLKNEEYKGLISYQFAYRFSLKDSDAVELFKTRKNIWLTEILKSKLKIDFSK